jgi:nucleotide-binding universal stress UspA family protein
MTDIRGLPAIEAYKVGEVYFVLDGNHRVSVARELGATYIEGYVREVQTRVPIEANTSPDDLIIKADYASFLKRTKLDRERSEVDLTITEPGRYRVLEDQIEAYRIQEDSIDQAVEQAAGRWYDEAYMPIVTMIRERGMLRGFPGRTETDLYVWITQHHLALEQALGWEIKPRTAAADLEVLARSNKRLRAGRKVSDSKSLSPSQLHLPPERWRAGIFEGFGFPLDILVALGRDIESWSSLDQAKIIAHREGARLLGLHVVESESLRDGEQALEVKAEFESRCGEAAISCQLAIDVGEAAQKINERGRWTDLVVVDLAHPPGRRPGSRTGSGFRNLIQHCPRPILAVPANASALNHAMLAYDGSAKSLEALYLATYLAGRWQIPLSVVTVTNGRRVTEQTLEQAGRYIEDHGVQHSLEVRSGEAVSAILETLNETSSDLLLIGGYGHTRARGAVLGSTVDQVLRKVQCPILICS